MPKKDLLQAKRCPHCGYVYDMNLPEGVNAQDTGVRFGKIYVTCPKCKQTFRDDDIYELAIMDPPKGYLKKSSEYIGIAAGAVAVWALFCALYVKKGDIAGAVLAGLVIGGFAIYGLFKECDRNEEHYRTVQNERWRSMERIRRDPEYARILQADGFRLPDGIEVADRPTEPATESEATPDAAEAPADVREIEADGRTQRTDPRDAESPFDEDSYCSREGNPAENETGELDVAGEKRRLMRYWMPTREEANKFNLFLFSACTFLFVCCLLPGNSATAVKAASAAAGIMALFFESLVIVLVLIVYRRVRTRIRELEESGELEHVLSDFGDAQELMEDRCRIGRDFLYLKASKVVILDYNDIERLEVSISGRDSYLEAHLKPRGKTVLCNLRSTDEDDVQKLIRVLCEKNPNMEIGA